MDSLFLLWGCHLPPAQRSLGWDHFHFLFLQLIGGDHPMVGGRFLTPVHTTVSPIAVRFQTAKVSHALGVVVGT